MSEKKVVIEVDEEVGAILVYDELNPFKGIDVLDISEMEKALRIAKEMAFGTVDEVWDN